MKIVYLIGNGFDLNLGMKTKYKDFYEYLKSCGSNSSHINKLRDSIEEGRHNWSDLERTLGEYLQYLTVSDSSALHDQIIEHLAEYIMLEENKYIIGEEQRNALFEYLHNPHVNRLLPIEVREVDLYREAWKNSHWDIKLITFNYTKSLERLLGNIKPVATIGKLPSGYAIQLTAIEHVHGFADERMILGVNDESQIKNNKLINIVEIRDRYIKSECNNTYGMEHDKKCHSWIKDANLICLFGLSFGETDKMWWEAVGKTLLRDCKVIIFEHAPNIKFGRNQGPSLKAAKEAVKRNFLSRANLDDAAIVKVMKNIYVAYNTDMFKFKISPNKDSEVPVDSIR